MSLVAVADDKGHRLRPASLSSFSSTCWLTILSWYDGPEDAAVLSDRTSRVQLNVPATFQNSTTQLNATCARPRPVPNIAPATRGADTVAWTVPWWRGIFRVLTPPAGWLVGGRKKMRCCCIRLIFLNYRFRWGHLNLWKKSLAP